MSLYKILLEHFPLHLWSVRLGYSCGHLLAVLPDSAVSSEVLRCGSLLPLLRASHHYPAQAISSLGFGYARGTLEEEFGRILLL